MENQQMDHPFQMMPTPLLLARLLLPVLLLPLLTLLLALFGIAWLSEALGDIGANRRQLHVVRAHPWTARLALVERR